MESADSRNKQLLYYQKPTKLTICHTGPYRLNKNKLHFQRTYVKLVMEHRSLICSNIRLCGRLAIQPVEMSFTKGPVGMSSKANDEEQHSILKLSGFGWRKHLSPPIEKQTLCPLERPSCYSQMTCQERMSKQPFHR